MAKICRFCGRKLRDWETVCPACKHQVVDTCPIDGTKVYSDEAFCPTCGSPIIVKCSCCGKLLYAGEKFCPYCGVKNDSLNNLLVAADKTNASRHQSCTCGRCGMPQFGMTPYGMPQYGMPYGFGFGYNMPYGGYGYENYAPIVLPTIYEGVPQLPAPAPTPNPQASAPDTNSEKRQNRSAERVRPDPDKRKCKLGIAGFVLSLLSFILPILFLFGIPISAVAIKKDKDHKKLAIAGLILGIIAFLIWLAAVIYVFVFQDGVTYLEWLGMQIGIIPKK